MSVTMKRVDLKPKEQFLSAIYDESTVVKGGDIVEAEVTRYVRKAIHPDMGRVFDRLTPHLLFACELAKIQSFDPEYYKGFKYADEPQFKGVSVTGVVWIGKDRDGVKLIGRKTTESGAAVSIVTPIIYFNSESEYKYPLVTILDEEIDNFEIEATSYFTKGKFMQPELQLQ